MRDPYIGREVAGQFRIVERIGSGGMGAVYKAEQPEMGRFVAIKILHSRYASRPDIVARFRREARAMSQLSHPNTARVFLYGQLEDGACYFVMEYLEGKNLAQCIRSEGPFPLERVVRIMGRVCEALDEAHRMGIIHRDLKPENIFLTTQGGIPDFPKVLDFGLAKVSEQQLRPTSLVLTRQGMIFGTPEFMSPEQAKGENIDHRSDIYSLAVIAYELLTGKLPFDAKHSLEYLQKHIREPPIPISVRLPDREWPKGLWEVLAKALAKQPEDRFESAGAFGKALEEVLEGVPAGQERSLGTSGRSPEPEALEHGTIPDLHEIPQPSQEPPKAPVPRIAWVVFGIGAFLAVVAVAALIFTWMLLRQGAS
ncbi:MAG: serine/threonine protein kinase [Sandaracinaceae bacterium]|nr:serine/threonine protein kinase [Sandaracinaceae bacterium]